MTQQIEDRTIEKIFLDCEQHHVPITFMKREQFAICFQYKMNLKTVVFRTIRNSDSIFANER
jgi:hypothetical protein